MHSGVVPRPLQFSQNGHYAHVRKLLADDGTQLHAEHVSIATTPDRAVAFVLVPGFTQHIAQPRVHRISAWLSSHGGVISLDLRGHGRSSGVSTLGRHEILDVAAAVAWARTLGYRSVVTVGFSMGASVAVRHAALLGDVDAVASVSSPGQWFYRGTPPMRLLHHLVLTPVGRATLRAARGVRVSPTQWEAPYPIDPVAAAAKVKVPLLVVHGDNDHYFPAHHGWRIHAAAPRSTLWLVPGFGHAERGMTPDLAKRIGHWLIEATEEAEWRR